VEYTTTANDREKYATYTRDSVTGLDYAMNRYYSSQWGRFLSPDPYANSAGLGDPGGWNRYAYTRNDPVNQYDPRGLDACPPDDPWLDEPDDPTTGGVNFLGGVGGGTPSRPTPQPLDPPKIPCIQPAHPGLGDDQIQKMIADAQTVLSQAVVGQVAHAGAGAAGGIGGYPLTILLGFLTAQFSVNGSWDFKDAPGVGQNTVQQAQLRDFGNFAFGAVLESLGFSYYQTQNAAGLAQIGICLGGGACGTGVPVLAYPFGDQVSDAKVVQKGYNYEAALESGNCLKP
jgi:RHS repeat-associated protein